MNSSTPVKQRQPSGKSLAPEGQSFPNRTESNGAPKRRPSFSFLHRSKSTERVTPSRSVSGAKLTKRQRAYTRDQELLKEQIPPRPPQIPDLPRPPQLQSFGGEALRPDSLAILSNKTEDFNQHPRIISKASMEQPSPRMYPHVPIPPIPGRYPGINGDPPDPYARSESMTNRGRYSYASSAVSTINNPRKMRRRKDPTPFNVLIIGARNSGKSGFLDFLRTSLALPAHKQRPQLRDNAYNDAPPVPSQAFPSFTSHYVETEFEGERVGVTLWDSKGLENNLVDLQLREMSSFLESKFHDTFSEELKVVRSPGARDTHVHCVFLLLDPVRLGSNLAVASGARSTSGALMNGNSFFGYGPGVISDVLDENLDLQVLRTLQSKTTVVPVISKADTITTAHMTYLKRVVWAALKRANIDPLASLGLEDLEVDDKSDHIGVNIEQEHLREDRQSVQRHDRSLSHTSRLESPSDNESSFSASEFDLGNPSKQAQSALTHNPSRSSLDNPFVPLSVISPDPYEPDVVGRRFAWGFADPYNPEHCDFSKLKESIFADWRRELREASREIYYEGWRTERLNRRTAEKKIQGSGGAKVFHMNQQARF